MASAGIRAAVLMPVAAARASLSAGAAGAEAPQVTGRILKLNKFELNPAKREAVADAAKSMPGELRYALANWIAGQGVLFSKMAGDVRSSGNCG